MLSLLLSTTGRVAVKWWDVRTCLRFFFGIPFLSSLTVVEEDESNVELNGPGAGAGGGGAEEVDATGW